MTKSYSIMSYCCTCIWQSTTVLARSNIKMKRVRMQTCLRSPRPSNGLGMGLDNLGPHPLMNSFACEKQMRLQRKQMHFIFTLPLAGTVVLVALASKFNLVVKFMFRELCINSHIRYWSPGPCPLGFTSYRNQI